MLDILAWIVIGLVVAGFLYFLYWVGEYDWKIPVAVGSAAGVIFAFCWAVITVAT